MKNDSLEYVKSFLEANGFEEIEPDSYANDYCSVVISELGYEVANNEGNVIYSSSHNIYWLIGALTWFGYIDKNYKKP